MDLAAPGMRSARRRGRIVTLIAVVVGIVGAFVAPPAQAQVPLVDGVLGAVGGLLAPATAQADPVQHLLAGINSVRAGVGVGPVTLDPVVSLVAQTWALVMATAGEISHNPDVGSQLNGILAVAENVGRGPSLDWIHNGLIGSPSHYKNMVNPNYTVVGLGVLTLGAQTWVVEDFVRPLGAVSAPPPGLRPGPEADATPAPAPVRTATPPPPSAVKAAVPAAVPAPPVTVPPAPPAAPVPSEWLSTVLDGLSLLDRLSV
jgi:Cysteine-rich secretory protein family